MEPTPELLEYLRKGLAQGVSRADITAALIGAGWDKDSIRAGFKRVDVTASQPDIPVSKALEGTPIAPKIITPPKEYTAPLRERALAEEVVGKMSNIRSSANSVGGFVGWLIRHRLARSVQQAQYILISVIVATLGGAVWVNWPSNRGQTGDLGPPPGQAAPPTLP